MLILVALLNESLSVELLFEMSKRKIMFGYRQVVIIQKTCLIMNKTLVVPSWIFSCM